MNPELRKQSQPPDPQRPWSIDRYGRLIAGVAVFTFTLLGFLHHPYWHVATFCCAVNLVVTSLTDRCALHDILIRLGAREREDLFLPGHTVRPGVMRSESARQELSIPKFRKGI